ncbi:MAG TPA: glycosyltransferase, partial [Burkholderiales bacterium]
MRQKRILILVENLPSPFDRRVWQEAGTLRDAGYGVSIICPTGKGCEKKHELIDGIDIWRYDLPKEGSGALGYLAEYSAALLMTLLLSLKVWWKSGFDVVHACNPPDLFFLIGGFYKLFGKKFVFDHHDANPELYQAKFGKKGLFYRLMLWLEKLTFKAADISIATNHSYRRIAIGRGGMDPGRVFVVRSGPSLERMKIVAPVEALKKGRRYLVGYVGVMGKQEGID